MSRKVININGNIHSALKKYCGQKGYKISGLVEQLIGERINYVDPKVQAMSKSNKVNKH